MISNDGTEVAVTEKVLKSTSLFLSSKSSVKLYSLAEACKLAPYAVISIMAKVTAVKPPERLLKKDRKTHVIKRLPHQRLNWNLQRILMG